MEKIWLKNYPQDVPADINPDTYSSLVSMLEQTFNQYADLPAFYNFGCSLTYQEIDLLSLKFAAYIQQDLGMQKGDRLAIMLPNLLQYPVVMFGALRAGVIVVNVNPLYTVSELEYQLKNSGASAIVVLANFAATLQKALPATNIKHTIITYVGDLLPSFKALTIHFVLKYIKRTIPAFDDINTIRLKSILATKLDATFAPVSLGPSDIAFLQYTGGTTGVSKGAILTHRNLVANLIQAEAWTKPVLESGKEIVITALPLYHIFSLMANCLLLMKLGGLNVLVTNPRDLKSMIKDMRKFSFTVITGVNTLFNGLLKQPEFAKLNFSALKITLGGGMAVQRAVAEKWHTVTRVPLLEAYGLTETAPCVAINPMNLRAYTGTVGLPVSSTDICILDEAQQELTFGQAGELAIKGPQVMQGYWENLPETQKVFTKDGWLLTGDIASVDENGYLRILERKKDMIIVSGFNVYPNEVEDVIAGIEGVKEVAVIGVNDINSGEVPKAYIVANDQSITAESILAYCHTRLTAYKVPKHLEFCKELPKSNVGKILRRKLVDSSKKL